MAPTWGHPQGPATHILSTTRPPTRRPWACSRGTSPPGSSAGVRVRSTTQGHCWPEKMPLMETHPQSSSASPRGRWGPRISHALQLCEVLSAASSSIPLRSLQKLIHSIEPKPLFSEIMSGSAWFSWEPRWAPLDCATWQQVRGNHTAAENSAGADGSSRSRLPVWPPWGQLQMDGDAPPPPEINVYGLIF